MIGLDTNVLLRLYVNDDALQHAAAKRLLAKAVRDGERIWISCPVLCELVWALNRLYDADLPTCLHIVEGILETPIFVVENSALIRRACRRCAKGKGDFADYLIQELVLQQGVTTTYTYDKALLKEPGFAKP